LVKNAIKIGRKSTSFANLSLKKLIKVSFLRLRFAKEVDFRPLFGRIFGPFFGQNGQKWLFGRAVGWSFTSVNLAGIF